MTRGSGRSSGITSDLIVIHTPAARVPAHLLSHPLVAVEISCRSAPDTRSPLLPLACRRVFETALGRRRAGRRRARFQRTDNVACDSRVRLKIRGPANLAGAWSSAQPVPASPRPPRAAQRPAAARAPRAYERTNAKPASRVGQGSQTRGGTHPGCKATPE